MVTPMKPRIIVCGLGKTGLRIYRLLRQQGAEVVGMSDRSLPQGELGTIVYGDLRSPAILIQAGIREAQTLVLANHNDALNLAILTQARVLNPQIRILNRLRNHTLGERLDRTLAHHSSMSVSSLAAPIFAFAALGSRAVGQLHLYHQTWPIHEEIITDHHPWCGLPLQDLWENPSRMLIHYLPAEGELDLVSAVVQGQVLQAGDHLIVGTQPSRSLRRDLGSPWTKYLANLQQYQRHVRPVLWVSLALIATIAIATFTYVSINHHTSIADAFYFSVGMITGAGGNEAIAEQAPASIKVFTAIMMILGAGVIGIGYALINDFILGSRIRQFWDAARIPTRNHYVVCGLGGIGMEIVRQLHSQGHEVVVLECDPQNRFLPSARALGIPVMGEDASLNSTLQAAHITRAAALLTVTSDDTLNVEIALTAKAIAPKVPVIVRIQEPQFAQSVQEVFDFESVLCPPELSTYSFAAAALGGRILGNGMTEDLLWVALATLITPNHPFAGKTVQEAAIAAPFVPLYAETIHQTIHGWSLLSLQLTPGDVLYLTMPATELPRLWRNPGDRPLASPEEAMPPR